MQDHIMVTVTRRFSDGSGGTQSAVGTRAEMGAWLATMLPVPTSVKEGFTVDVKVSLPPTMLNA